MNFDYKYLRTSTKLVRTSDFYKAMVEKLPVRTSTDLNEFQTIIFNKFKIEFIYLVEGGHFIVVL